MLSTAGEYIRCNCVFGYHLCCCYTYSFFVSVLQHQIPDMVRHYHLKLSEVFGTSVWPFFFFAFINGTKQDFRMGVVVGAFFVVSIGWVLLLHRPYLFASFPWNNLPDMFYLLSRSGACIITFSMKSWLEVRNAKAKLSSTTGVKSTNVVRTLDGQKRRLFRIAMQTSTCLLLNVIVTVLISGALDDWSRASNLWLTCSTIENINSDRTNYEVATMFFAFKLNSCVSNRNSLFPTVPRSSLKIKSCAAEKPSLIHLQEISIGNAPRTASTHLK
jgi:hypothetical protein